MPNPYCELNGAENISDSYTQITEGFDGVKTDMDGKAPASVETELDAHIGAGGTAHAVATTGAAGFISATDKAKLDGISAGAQVNQNAFGKIVVTGQSDIDADSVTDALKLAGGTGITITTNAITDEVVITATGSATPGAHASSHITGGTDIIPNAVPSGNAGLMSGADKAALDQTVAGLAAHEADYVRQPGYGTTAGATNTYTLALNPALAAYTAGVAVAVKINVANTGASTININGLGAKNILDSKGNAMTSGKLRLNGVYTLRYDGTSFILQGEGGEYGTAVAAEVLAGKTIGTDTGLVSGTMVDRAGDTVALSSSIAGTTLKLRASDGYRDGTNDFVTITDANFVASKILAPNALFGLTGTLVAKKFASGAVTQGTTIKAVFRYDSGSDNRYFVTVSGLTFTPTIIFIQPTENHGAVGTVFKNNLFPVASGNQPSFMMLSSGSNFYYYLDGTNAYVNGSGFSLPYYDAGFYPSGGAPVNWIAVE